MKIYLAGSVPKGDKEALDYIDWRKDYFNIMSKLVDDIKIIDPNDHYKLEGDTKALFGSVCLQIQESDFVLVNAESKLGAGTSMEMVIAKYLDKPVITVLPKDSAHRKSNLLFAGREVQEWIHPFVDSFSDSIIENVSEIETAISRINENPIRKITIVDESMKYAQEMLNALTPRTSL
jgi:hypothetical protein